MKPTATQLNPQQKHLVENHLPLVSQIIKEKIFYDQTIPGMEYHDLYQAGCLALCKAALHYDSQRDFTPYAAASIRHALYDYSRKCSDYHKCVCSLETSVSDHSDAHTLWDLLSDTNPENCPLTQTEFSEAMNYLKRAEADSSGVVQKGIYSLCQKMTGLTSVEISQQFGVTSNTVRAWISLATKELRTRPELYQLLSN